jgi:hypothetical protein
VSDFEVRPFLPIDVPMMRRLVPTGMCFDSATALTRGVHVLEGAVWGAMPLADLGMPTYVLRSGDFNCVAQFRHRTGDEHAHIVFIAPSLDMCSDDTVWLRLLDAMTIGAGRRGALTLNAEVAEAGDAFMILRQAGFAIYARQEIWKRDPRPLPSPETRDLLRLSTDLDVIHIGVLQANVVPRMVRQADATPDARHGLVYTQKDHVLAYFSSQEGKNGIYVQAIVSPELSQGQTQDVLLASLHWLPRADKLPVYFNMRRYLSWLSGSLEEIGFEPYASQAVMVRHTVRRVESVVSKTANVMDGVKLALPHSRDYCSADWD